MDFDFNISFFGKEEKPKTEIKRAKIDPTKANFKTPKFNKKGEFFFFSGIRRIDLGGIMEDIKAEISNAEILAEPLSTVINSWIVNPKNWGIITTAKRSHFAKLGFHFASEICKHVANKTGIEFFPDVFEAKHKGKLNPDFSAKTENLPGNLILIDDIISTGMTIHKSLELLPGKNVIIFIGITNR